MVLQNLLNFFSSACRNTRRRRRVQITYDDVNYAFEKNLAHLKFQNVVFGVQTCVFRVPTVLFRGGLDLPGTHVGDQICEI